MWTDTKLSEYIKIERKEANNNVFSHWIYLCSEIILKGLEDLLSVIVGRYNLKNIDIIFTSMKIPQEQWQKMF